MTFYSHTSGVIYFYIYSLFVCLLACLRHTVALAGLKLTEICLPLLGLMVGVTTVPHEVLPLSPGT
ncbi:hypothetical protein ACQP3F_32275, partial [Escherichia coli]